MGGNRYEKPHCGRKDILLACLYLPASMRLSSLASGMPDVLFPDINSMIKRRLCQELKNCSKSENSKSGMLLSSLILNKVGNYI